MKRILLIYMTCVLLIMILLPTNVRGDYIENINIPTEVEEGESFTVSFDASYFVSGEVYTEIGLCDLEGNQIKDDDGYAIGVHWMKEKFIIGETPIKRNVKCQVDDQPEGTYKLVIAIRDANTNEQLMGTTTYTQSFELIKKSDSGSSSSCSSIYGVSMIGIIGLIVVKKKQ